MRAALREAPNVILIGELRDKDTMATALNAAETGHLVFATLHTANVIEAIDRILQYFPAEQQKQVCTNFANCFLGVVAQKLICKCGGGRVAAFEMLTKTDATVSLIRNQEYFRLRDYMSPAAGMLTMEQSIKDLKSRHFIE